MNELLSHLNPNLLQQLDFYFYKIDFIFLNRLSFLLFILAMLLATGLSLTVPQIIEPLRNWRLVIRSLIANLVIVPILVLGLLHFVPVSEPMRIGFTILAVAAGPPVLPKLAQMVNGNLAFAAGLMMVLMLASAIFMPIVLPLVLDGVQISPWQVAKPLFVSLLPPLAIGLLIRARFEAIAISVIPFLRRVNSFALILGLTSSLALQFNSLIVLAQSGIVLAIAIFIIVAFAVGYLLGGPNLGTRLTLGVGTAQRNIAGALIVAGTNFEDPAIISVIVVTSLSLFVVIRLIARFSVNQSISQQVPSTEVNTSSLGNPQ
ncbi:MULTISPECIES: bile acid:sodium symporter family protein [Pseudanabaena]|uniref:Bile acid:sodium symporter n=2 Tax=Pseudanabaena TaxID=1152 RepID=L8N6F7_9CYAN|nr:MULTISPECIES: bile acid:sodium symporter [Pseudanabaena]ELS34275.1 Bile acid:sodium symporter [Pseudanabaena biceps PCC 7429]MDG3493498.1 bile acid:sodium symporter [Pseudanabaena catenata USMAC16]